MFVQVTTRSFLWSVSTFAVLIIVIIGCGADGDEDDNDWVGSWRLESGDGPIGDAYFEEEGAGFSVVTNSWTFDNDGTMEGEIVVEGEYKDGRTGIQAKLSIEYMGTYSLTGSDYTLIMKEKTSGPFGDMSEITVEDAGTWSRKGNTLTLNSDDGITMVFKKK